MAADDKKAPPPPKRQDDTPCEEGLPPWMATFADMMSLLLCFFVLLLSFAQQDANKFKTLMGSIKEAFGVQVKRKEAPFAAFSPSDFERKDVELDPENKELLGMVLEIKNFVLQDPDLKKTAKISTDDAGVVIRIPTSEIFAPGSAKPVADAASKLATVVRIMKERNLGLVVRCHTSDRSLDSNSLYPTNWELSSARAATTLRILMQAGDIAPSRMKAVGYADSQPLLPNNTDENRYVNSRLEFYFHTPSVKSW
ncbi:flagellar motor protein MotB [Oleidesulfovibrio sp.]|uniref:flagellar motor protein MotB n=1 Tax=Oleidesulfovibrio sp. TaxID=2909707 RepID=UPI003A85AA90